MRNTLKFVGAVLVIAGMAAITGCGGQAAQPVAKVEPSAADEGAAAGSALVPSEVERLLMSQGANIESTFTSESGLKAVVATKGGDRRLFYVLPGGKYMMLGTVFDAKGGDVTSNDMSRASIRTDVEEPKHSVEDQAKLWEMAAKSRFVAEGGGDDVVYVIFDPNCPYCHQLWEKVRPAVEAGRAKVRWIPVAILAASSANLAAAVYQAQDQAKALAELNEGSLTQVKVSGDTEAALESNLQLFRSTGYTAVPTVIYRDGNEVKVTTRALSDEDLLNSIFHLK